MTNRSIVMWWVLTCTPSLVRRGLWRIRVQLWILMLTCLLRIETLNSSFKNLVKGCNRNSSRSSRCILIPPPKKSPPAKDLTSFFKSSVRRINPTILTPNSVSTCQKTLPNSWKYFSRRVRLPCSSAKINAFLNPLEPLLLSHIDASNATLKWWMIGPSKTPYLTRTSITCSI